MVCPRCISAVSNILQEQEIEYSSIKLGEVELMVSLYLMKVKPCKKLTNINDSILNDKVIN